MENIWDKTVNFFLLWFKFQALNNYWLNCVSVFFLNCNYLCVCLTYKANGITKMLGFFQFPLH